jgi:hypothetical protein
MCRENGVYTKISIAEIGNATEEGYNSVFKCVDFCFGIKEQICYNKVLYVRISKMNLIAIRGSHAINCRTYLEKLWNEATVTGCFTLFK